MMRLTRLVTLFIGVIAFAVLAVMPYPEYTTVPDYGRPLFVFGSIFCLICWLWILRRGSFDE